MHLCQTGLAGCLMALFGSWGCGVSGVAVAAAAFSPDKPNVAAFDPIEARFVRLIIASSSSGQPCIDELEIYGPGKKANLALATWGGKASASSCLPGYAIHQVAHLNDGRYGNSHSWIAAGKAREWAQIELPRATTINQVVFSRDREGTFRDRMPRGVEVHVSMDGQAWKTVAKLGGGHRIAKGRAPVDPPPDATAKRELKLPEAAVSEEKPPEPIPNAALLPDAEFLVRDFFKADFAGQGLADRAGLVKKLLREASQTNTDMDLKYVLLREAYDAARTSGQFELAMVAARAMARAFQVDGAKLKTDVFSKVAPTTPEGRRALLDCILHELEAATTDNRYAEALQLIGLAKGWAARLKDTELQARLRTQAGDLTARQTAFEKCEKARQTLIEKPDDAASHLTVGAFLCFHKREWEAGLPHLAKCAVPAFKKAATIEMERPTEGPARADLGDLWWSQAAKEKGAPKAAMQDRAIVWYFEALADLPAERKAAIQKRLLSSSGLVGTAVGKLKTAGLVFYVNPGADPTGKACELLTLTPARKVGPVSTVTVAGVKALKLAESYVSYPATDAVKAVGKTGSFFVWIRHEQSIASYAGVIFRGTGPKKEIDQGVADFSLFLANDRFRLWFNWPENEWPGVDGKTTFISENALPIGRWTMCGATWNGTAIAIYIDGKRDRVCNTSLTPLLRKRSEIIALGCDPAGAPEFYPGLMSCAMIFNRALTAAQVKQLHGLSAVLGLSGIRE